MAKPAEVNNESEALALIERYIEKDPNKPGRSNVRLKDYGVHVWALVGYGPAVNDDLEEIARAYDIPLEAVKAAMLYYERNRGPIDYRLEEMAAAYD